MQPERAVIDCRALALRDQFDAWTAAVNQSFVPLSADRTDRERRSFGGMLISQPLGPAAISNVQGGAVRVRRTAAQIARSDPGYIKLGLQVTGNGVVTQDGRQAVLAPGDFTLYDTTRQYTLDFRQPFRMFVVMFPLSTLRTNRERVATITASRIRGDQGLRALTSRFLTAMSEQLAHAALSSVVAVSDAVFDLVSATIAEPFEGNQNNDDPDRRQVLVKRIESFICAHLADPRLSVQFIADTHHISVRHLQKMFEDRQSTVSGWIRHRRLEQCRRDLADPGLAPGAIARIGARWGFANASAFTRAFKSAYGVPPSEYRAHRARP